MSEQDTAECAGMLRRQLKAAGISELSDTAVILGSGQGHTAEIVAAAGGAEFSYADLSALPRPRVRGHRGRLVFGTGVHSGLMFFQGRSHYYEGCSPADLTAGVRLAAELGVRLLVVTNAAGGIRTDLLPGTLMLIDSHLVHGVHLRPRHPDSVRIAAGAPCRTMIWDRELTTAALGVRCDLPLKRGTYVMNSGPCYETPAEIRALRMLGADAVGMSTVPEAAEGVRRGMRVLGVSCITNSAAGLSSGPLSHHEVEETAASVRDAFADWLLRAVQACRKQLHGHESRIP